MQLDNYVKSYNIYPLNLFDECHVKIFKDIYELNKVMIKDDSLNSVDDLIEEFKYNISKGLSIGFIVFVNEVPYGVLYASIDRYKNASIHGSTYDRYDNMHFYTTQRLLRCFIKVLFEKYKVNKIRAEFPIYNKKAEAAMRYLGLKKEGHLTGEYRINSKPITTLLLGLTKEDYFEKGKDLKHIKYCIKKIDPEKKRKIRKQKNEQR